MRLFQGDCIEIMKTLPDNSIDMVLTDPPYGTTACKWDNLIDFAAMWRELMRVARKNAAILLFGSEPFSSHLRLSSIKEFKYDWIWYKNTQTGMSFAKYQPMRAYECISVFYRERPAFNKQPTESRIANIETREGKLRSRKGGFESAHLPGIKTHNKTFSKSVNPRNVLEFNVVNNANGMKVHPTQKPVALLEYLIKTYTNEKQTVLDFTMGSGSTGVACINTDRDFVGIELDKNYFEIAGSRINRARLNRVKGNEPEPFLNIL